MAGTATHAIVVKVRFKPGMEDAATKVLEDEVIPGAKGAEGFVGGYWMHPGDNSYGISFELFDSLADAEAEMGRRTTEAPPDMPVEILSADIVEVIGRA